jgi:serine/alanine adding enzyme
MGSTMTLVTSQDTQVLLRDGDGLRERLPALEAFVDRHGRSPLSTHPSWPLVLEKGLGHRPMVLEVVDGEATRGYLPLVHIRSLLFGRHLVSLPYLNYGGVQADDEQVVGALVVAAVALADRLDVRHLELRHETPLEHPALPERLEGKVHMRLDLPATPGQLWDGLDPKVRNQVRKGGKHGLTVHWGRDDLLDAFYDVFCRNMRDLGTPVFGRRLFAAVLQGFPERAELCVVRAGEKPIAGALLLHGRGVTEVPSASSLRSHNHTCANMLMYWHLLERAIGRGQDVFDFGRSTPGGGTYRFKEQWGARPHPASWQFYTRGGSVADMRPDNPRFRRIIEVWKRLPVPVTRWIGPAIVRGIP